MTEVTQAAFARLKSVSKKTVTEWKQQGRIIMSGNLVNVEASQQCLRKGASHKSAGKLRGVTPPAEVTLGVTPKVTNIVTAAAYFDGAEYGNPANLPDEIVNVSTAIGSGAFDLALLAGRYLPMAVVRALVAEWGIRQRQSWTGGPGLPDSNADIEWPEPPIGYARWSDHRLFTDPLLQDSAWLEIEADIAEWKAANP